jgi:RNA polymerase-binding transcription factor DksA
MTRKNLIKYEKRLLEVKTQILKQRGFTGAMLVQLERENGSETVGNPADSGEQGYETYQRELASKMTSGQTKALMEIDEALRRVELKTYGICENCGRPISQARLGVLPQSRYCMRCVRSKEAFRPPQPPKRRRRR